MVNKRLGGGREFKAFTYLQTFEICAGSEYSKVHATLVVNNWLEILLQYFVVAIFRCILSLYYVPNEWMHIVPLYD